MTVSGPYERAQTHTRRMRVIALKIAEMTPDFMNWVNKHVVVMTGDPVPEIRLLLNRQINAAEELAEAIADINEDLADIALEHRNFCDDMIKKIKEM